MKSLVLLGLSLFVSPSEAKKKKMEEVGPPTPTSNFYIRTTFDKDPTGYLGRFVSDDAEFPDESAARQTRCSSLIDYKMIDAGGVTYDEVMSAGGGVLAGLKIPAVDSISFGVSSETGVRATYTLTQKMVAQIDDPVAFEACCRESPTNCSSQFVGEFIEGTGELWMAHSQFVGVRFLEKLQSRLPVDVEASGEYNWTRSREFSEPIYFAYKLVDVPKVDCKALVNNPPRSDAGLYFGGMSDPAVSERYAKDKAMDNAREQIVKYVAEELQIDINQLTSVSAADGSMSGDETTMISRFSEGVTSRVRAEMFCETEVVETPDGPKYTASVLAFIPKESMEQLQGELGEEK
jgi:hypothetical protein